jgi:hypothetical protein
VSGSSSVVVVEEDAVVVVARTIEVVGAVVVVAAVVVGPVDGMPESAVQAARITRTATRRRSDRVGAGSNGIGVKRIVPNETRPGIPGDERRPAGRVVVPAESTTTLPLYRV